MAQIKYRDTTFNPEAQGLIVHMVEILQQYRGSRVTARQLYYRMFAKNWLPDTWIDPVYNAKHHLHPTTKNTDKNYKRLSTLIVDARYAGLIDWDAIEDRTREPTKPRDWKNGSEALAETLGTFRLDRWEGQSNYIEIWVEKEALAGVLSPITADYHLVLMANKGYSSASAMKESADRIKHWSKSKKPTVIYVGDHDPSGNQMTVDIFKRLMEFGCPANLDVRKVALTWEQIQRNGYPPNPVKLTDARAASYIKEFGDECWEVDAMPPDELNLLVRQTINAYVDKKTMEAVIKKESAIKTKIKKFAATFVE